MPTVKPKKPVPEPKGKTIPELAKEMKAWMAKKKKAEAAAEEAASVVHKIAVTLLPPLLDRLEGNAINLPGIGYVDLGIELYTYVKKEDEPSFFKWLRQKHEGDIIKETIHPKTLKAWASEWYDDPEKAGQLPDILKITPIPTAKLLKEKKR